MADPAAEHTLRTPVAVVADAPIRVLHLGCGRRQTVADLGLEFRTADGTLSPSPIQLVNLDANPDVAPDLLCLLGQDRIALPDDSIDFAVAHHVIEHIGAIGQVTAWFFFWEELYRVLKPGARVQFECPYHSSVWAWADPTHVRAISEYTFLYLNQDAYTQGGSIPDYRPPFDFLLESWQLREDDINPEVRAKEPVSFIRGSLVARKPLRPYWERDPVSPRNPRADT